jgi:hypothetical protein
MELVSKTIANSDAVDYSAARRIANSYSLGTHHVIRYDEADPADIRANAGYTLAGHRVGHYSAQGKLLTPLTKIKAVEKMLRGKITEQTFPLNLQIPQTTRDSHFPTASATTG